MTPHRALVPALGLALTLALSGCGEDEPAPHDAAEASPTPSGGATPGNGSPSATPRPKFDPCEDLAVASVVDELGQKVRLERGSEDAPVCRLIPAAENGVAFELNYQWYPDGLSSGFAEAPPAGTMTSPDVPGADDARLIVQGTDEVYTVTGFVQNGDLIQVANGVAPAPYRAQKVRAGMLALLAEMSGNAPAGA